MPKAFSEGGWADKVQGNFFSFCWEVSLEADEPQAGQQHENAEKKREYYHIIIFPGRTCNFISRKKRTNEDHNNGTLQRHLLPQVRTCYQIAYQSLPHSLLNPPCGFATLLHLCISILVFILAHLALFNFIPLAISPKYCSQPLLAPCPPFLPPAPSRSLRWSSIHIFLLALLSLIMYPYDFKLHFSISSSIQPIFGFRILSFLVFLLFLSLQNNPKIPDTQVR